MKLQLPLCKMLAIDEDLAVGALKHVNFKVEIYEK
jgi:hypothetical protein